MIDVYLLIFSIFIGGIFFFIGHYMGFKQGWESSEEWMQDQIIDMPTDEDLIRYRKELQYKYKIEKE